MNRGYIRGHVERGSAKDGPIRFVAATEGVKRDGIDLRMQGAELDRFRANPVILFGHNSWGRQNLPIGRADNVGVEGDALMMDISFDQEDDFARTVERKIRSGFLNAVSIGFDVRGWEKPGQNMWNGGVATKWELFETSVVPVPMDERATVESGRSLHDENLRQYIQEQIAKGFKEEFQRYFAEIDKRVQVTGVDAQRVMASLKFGGEN
ncbi:HK97 family phage prohead protease [Nonomuraea sp. NPDC050451]|uniref:HK97 family phage prohead protease n=1 Tax=Nonomuraea sp. NPDC050451 TaxID=3364364 RepID=UPI0037B060D4